MNLFSHFNEKFSITSRADGKMHSPSKKLGGLYLEVPDLERFFYLYGGASFNFGVYRAHLPENLDKWNQVIYRAFPNFKGKAVCFGYDWLGRQFALDAQRKMNGKPLVLLFEPGTGLALEVPATFMEFHEELLIKDEDADAALAEVAFNEWRKTYTEPIAFNKCVGYVVPLFLGGEDEFANFELTDMEVYWELCGQMLVRARGLRDGDKIGNIDIDLKK